MKLIVWILTSCLLLTSALYAQEEVKKSMLIVQALEFSPEAQKLSHFDKGLFESEYIKMALGIVIQTGAYEILIKEKIQDDFSLKTLYALDGYLYYNAKEKLFELTLKILNLKTGKDVKKVFKARIPELNLQYNVRYLLEQLFWGEKAAGAKKDTKTSKVKMLDEEELNEMKNKIISVQEAQRKDAAIVKEKEKRRQQRKVEKEKKEEEKRVRRQREKEQIEKQLEEVVEEQKKRKKAKQKEERQNKEATEALAAKESKEAKEQEKASEGGTAKAADGEEAKEEADKEPRPPFVYKKEFYSELSYIQASIDSEDTFHTKATGSLGGVKVGGTLTGDRMTGSMFYFDLAIYKVLKSDQYDIPSLNSFQIRYGNVYNPLPFDLFFAFDYSTHVIINLPAEGAGLQVAESKIIWAKIIARKQWDIGSYYFKIGGFWAKSFMGSGQYEDFDKELVLDGNSLGFFIASKIWRKMSIVFDYTTIHFSGQNIAVLTVDEKRIGFGINYSFL